jgi:iron complex transport system substrate-binding protein
MRIASLISSGTEILWALGLGQQVVAVSHECDFPAEAAKLPRATRSRIDSAQSSDEIDRQVKHCLQAGQPLYEVDAELLCRQAPDLIVTQAQCDVCAVRYADVVDLVRSRPELRNTRVVALNPQSLDDVLLDVRRVGQAAGAAAAAERVATGLSQRIEEISSRTRRLPAGERPRVVCIEWVLPLMTAGNWTPNLIELAGGRCGLAIAGQHSGYVEFSAVREFDPEVLLVAPCGFDLARSQREARLLAGLPGFGDLPAVKSGRAYVLNGNAYLNRSGPRLVDSLEILAHLLHPELFDGVAWASAHAPLVG